MSEDGRGAFSSAGNHVILSTMSKAVETISFQGKKASESDGDKYNNVDNKCDTGQEMLSSELLSSIRQQSGSGSRSHFGQSVIIVQNSSDLKMEDLEPSLLKCMKQALANAEGQHSFTIGKVSEESNEEQTTYIIDLDSLGKQTDKTRECLSASNQNGDLEAPTSSEMVTAPLDVSLVETLGTTSTQHSKTTKDIAPMSSSPSSYLDFQEQVEISFVTCPSQMDLNNPSSEAEVSIEIMCSQNEPLPISQSSDTLYIHESVQMTGKATAARNLSGVTQSSISLSALPHMPPKTSSVSCYSHSPSSSLLSSSSHKAETSTDRLSAHRESHIPLENLLHITKKIIEDKTHSRKLITGQQPHEDNATPPHIEISEKDSSESIITMYLSLPRDLKETIQKLNINPSAVIMQADNETSVYNKEAKETNTDSCDSSQKTQSQKPGDAYIESGISFEKCTDSLVSILPSATSSGVVYRCAECGYCSHNKHYYKQHVDLVHNEDRPYKCPHCDYAGKRRHALLEHLVVHSNQRPFTCDHCNASFRKKGHLTNHIKLHTSQRLVHCGVCNIQLPDAEAFESHLRKIHNTDKLYKCRLCDYTVVDKEVMLKHLHEHNEAVMYSCPKCPSLFNDEESLVHHLKGNHHFSFIQKSTQNPGDTGKTCMPETVRVSQPASIICSECGFVCQDTEMMQQHMWVHIKKEDKHIIQINDKIKINPVSHDEGCSNLGVLKMNVDLGQKTLPKDVVYQCSGCSFTSSDNSVFIKHMLAHKTQEKKQHADLSVHSKFPGDEKQVVETQQNTSAQSTFKPVSYYAGSKSDPQIKPDSAVPFIYDKASARFRCVICGYHCEFQRTIKAHIWKHSGHQSIEYPTFDHLSSTKTNAGSPIIQILPNKELFKPMDTAPLASVTSAAATVEMSHNLPFLRTRSGETVQLVPVNPLNTNYSPGDIIQIKNNSVIIPAEGGKASAASRFLESVAFPDECTDGTQFKERAMVQSASKSLVTMHANELSLGFSNTATTNQSQGKKRYSGTANVASKLDKTDQIDTQSSCDVAERCNEPSVVVEVMDTIPSGSGLTGMKSQQGSPRIPDLDGNTGEERLSKTLRTIRDRRSSGESDTSLSESEKAALDRTDIKTSYFQATDPSKNHHSYSARLRCPTCDCLLTEDFKTHLLSCQRKTGDEEVKDSELESTFKAEDKKLFTSFGDPRGVDNAQAEDTDSLESSDELANSGSSTGQQKSGICSSLLAVIEQLRERSRSESEEDKQGPPASKKGGKKKMRHDDQADLLSIEDLQNIEKISENGSDKFRCSLCHYSSHRICNIKLHMKTHRQKKPSECSLCDFSSSSPEALQEHMLKHCKVRTYPCKFCPQSFNHKSTLRAHLRAHKDQEPFLCAYCVYETTNPMEYREHMQVHSGCSTRLRCPGCDLILSNKEELTAHLLMCKGGAKRNRPDLDRNDKSDINTEQDYEKLEQKSTLDSAPTSHACVVHGCSFSSCNLKELQDHLSVHCNPSLLVCNLCDFKALHSRSLKSHMKRHANDQRYVQQPLEQYKCNLCGYVCHHLPSLKSHMWRHASDQSYSYEFTNDVINAAIDHDTRVDADGEADDPELLDRVINSERKILEGELTKFSKGDGQRPICWVTFRCCSCGFETINKAKLNIHMRNHSDIIQKALDIPRKPGNLQNKTFVSPLYAAKYASKRSNILSNLPGVPLKIMKKEEIMPV